MTGQKTAQKPAPTPARPVPATHDFSVGSPAFNARADMRLVWSEHLLLTRTYIISAMAGLPDAQPVSTRLLQSAEDIGVAMQPYYGDATSKKFTLLLKDHVMILADLAQTVSGRLPGVATRASSATRIPATTDNGAAHDIDKDQMSMMQRRLENNAKNIAAFLNSSNPYWRQSDFEGMMQAHVDLEVEQITARANGDWQADIRAFDQALDGVYRFADALSLGIEQQFPDRFAQAVN